MFQIVINSFRIYSDKLYKYIITITYDTQQNLAVSRLTELGSTFIIF